MAVAINQLKRKMVTGSIAIGFGVREMKSVSVGLVAASAGYDCLFIDLEHGALSGETVSQIAIAALGQGVTPLVRCCKDALHEGVRLLDNGAMGLVVPHVDSVAEAEAIIAACRYPPRGFRSLSSLLPHLGYEGGDWAELAPRLDGEQLLFLMAETTKAVADIDAIVALDGFDGILVGAADLAADMGCLGDPTNARVVDACLAIAAACGKAGKLFAVGGVRDERVTEALMAAGARLVLAGADISFMRAGAEAASRRLRSIAARAEPGVGTAVESGR